MVRWALDKDRPKMGKSVESSDTKIDPCKGMALISGILGYQSDRCMRFHGQSFQTPHFCTHTWIRISIVGSCVSMKLAGKILCHQFRPFPLKSRLNHRLILYSLDLRLWENLKIITNRLQFFEIKSSREGVVKRTEKLFKCVVL